MKIGDLVTTAIESIVVLALAIATAALLYSHWFHDCCKDFLEIPISILFLPGVIFGVLFAGGSIHGASEIHFYAGICVQFLLIFWLVKWIRHKRRAR